MKTNVGTADRFLRVMFGIPFLVYGIMHMSLVGIIGVALIATGLFGFCGLYTLMGADTCQQKDGKCTL